MNKVFFIVIKHATSFVARKAFESATKAYAKKEMINFKY